MSLYHSTFQNLVKATVDSAGYDVKSAASFTLEPGTITKIPTKVRMEISKGYFGKIESRSSYSMKGIIAVGGVIDSDYRGEIFVNLMNFSQDEFVIEAGDRIAQLIIIKIDEQPLTKVEEIEVFSSTERGSCGYGSTGKN